MIMTARRPKYHCAGVNPPAMPPSLPVPALAALRFFRTQPLVNRRPCANISHVLRGFECCDRQAGPLEQALVRMRGYDSRPCIRSQF